MPDITVTNLKQKAVLWERDGSDRYGQVQVSSTPSEISCRWEQTDSGRLSQDSEGVSYQISVHTAQYVAPGSVMWEGKLVDLPGSYTDDLYVVDSCATVPDLKGRHKKYTLALSKFKGTLPTS